MIKGIRIVKFQNIKNIKGGEDGTTSSQHFPVQVSGFLQ